jgi:hypothetical protein
LCVFVSLVPPEVTREPSEDQHSEPGHRCQCDVSHLVSHLVSVCVLVPLVPPEVTHEPSEDRPSEPWPPRPARRFAPCLRVTWPPLPDLISCCQTLSPRSRVCFPGLLTIFRTLATAASATCCTLSLLCAPAFPVPGPFQNPSKSPPALVSFSPPAPSNVHASAAICSLHLLRTATKQKPQHKNHEPANIPEYQSTGTPGLSNAADTCLVSGALRLRRSLSPARASAPVFSVALRSPSTFVAPCLRCCPLVLRPSQPRCTDPDLDDPRNME